MFDGIKNGSVLILQSVLLFLKRPKLLFPLLLCWGLYAPLIVYLKFHFPWENYQIGYQLVFAFLFILLMTIIFSWAAFVLLDLIRKLENDKPMSMAQSFLAGIQDTIKAFPIVLIWASLWFFITLIEVLVRRKSEESDDEAEEEFNAENVAATLAGFDDVSLSAAFFDALRKGVRMLAFLIYPAIAWENQNYRKAIKKGLAVAKAHRLEFAAGIVLTDLVAGLVFLPPAIMFYLSKKCHIEFSDITWFIVMLYCGFAWSFTLLLEQLFVAELYLWNALWEQECRVRQSKGEPMPLLNEVKRPSILDDDADMRRTRIRSYK